MLIFAPVYCALVEVAGNDDNGAHTSELARAALVIVADGHVVFVVDVLYTSREWRRGARRSCKQQPVSMISEDAH